jgi:hypothetical protein
VLTPVVEICWCLQVASDGDYALLVSQQNGPFIFQSAPFAAKGAYSCCGDMLVSPGWLCCRLCFIGKSAKWSIRFLLYVQAISPKFFVTFFNNVVA